MDTEIYGDRVRSARLLRGWKSVDLAAALGWPPSRQTTAEQSEVMHLDPRSLEILVRELKFPEAFFASPPSAPLRPDELLFRAPVATTKREKSYLAEFARITGEMLFWLDSFHRLPPVKLPSLDPKTPVSDAALLARESLGIDAGEPIPNLTHRLERAGLPIVVRTPAWTALPEKHLGYSTRVGDHRERPLTILRSQDSWERMRYTLAHEIAHVLLHSSLLPSYAEDQAHEFAGEFLAPADTLRKELPRFVTLASLTEIKMRWGISIGALILHLARNGLITDERKDTLRKQLYTRINPGTGRTWGKDEPGWDARQTELPSMVTTWMQRCLGGTAPNLVASLSGVYPADVISMITTRQRDLGSQGPRRPEKSKPRVVPIRQSGSSVVDLETRRLRA